MILYFQLTLQQIKQAHIIYLQAQQQGTGSNRSILVSGTPVYIDTRADTSAYSAGSIPETQDQPTNITSYYLHRNEFASNPVSSMQLPAKIDSSNNIQEYNFNTTFPEHLTN